jgi:hypothetical protein
MLRAALQFAILNYVGLWCDARCPLRYTIVAARAHNQTLTARHSVYAHVMLFRQQFPASDVIGEFRGENCSQ